jgi:hypothetical protein
VSKEFWHLLFVISTIFSIVYFGKKLFGHRGPSCASGGWTRGTGLFYDTTPPLIYGQARL